MCWSSESSRNAYIIGSVSSLILMLFGDKVDKNIGLFFFSGCTNAIDRIFYMERSRMR